MTMNKIIVIGNVGNDPEMRYTPSGAAVTSFNVATNRTYTTSDGERREETEWFRVSAWGRQAESCNNYVTKGMRVYAEGRLSTRSYVGNDGQNRTSLEINADRVLFLDRAGDRAGDRAEDRSMDRAADGGGAMDRGPFAGPSGPPAASDPTGPQQVGTDDLPW